MRSKNTKIIHFLALNVLLVVLNPQGCVFMDTKNNGHFASMYGWTIARLRIIETFFLKIRTGGSKLNLELDRRLTF